MRHTKRLASLLLALAMVFALATTAFAAQEGPKDGGSITIDNAVVGQTYRVYQILYLESYDKKSGAYSYKANSAWEDWLETQTQYVSIDTQGYVTWVSGADAAAFAKAARAYAKANNIPSDSADVTATSKEVKFESLKLGYYLVDSTLGTLCSLNTTKPDVTIQEKNAEPTNVKTVEEDSNQNYGSVNDADIGQTVNFKSAITLPKGSENIVFHDKMSGGLTLNAGSIKVYDQEMNTELDAGNYTVDSSDLTDDCTFEISFDQTYLNGLTADSTTVYVKYTATVNENAVVGDDGNTNVSKVSYGDENNIKTTPDSTTTTYTWSFDVLKYANGNESKVLAGAQFVLLNSNKDKAAEIVNGKLTEWKNGSTSGTTLTTDSDGKITIAGLDAGTYYLRETAAPDGYNKLAGDVEVNITPTKTNAGTSMTLSPVTAKVENKSGSLLPSSGGMGTTIFYMLGGILVIGAAVLLITKKRMSVKK